MPKFFIDRPVFAWVIAIFIALAGLVAIPQLPVARFPVVAPPSISIFATYTGATAQTVNDSVVAPIEKELASVRNVLYYESTVDSTGGPILRSPSGPAPILNWHRSTFRTVLKMLNRASRRQSGGQASASRPLSQAS